MEIFINSEKIDFQLEEEILLLEVVEGLLTWANNEGVYLQQIKYDDEIYKHDYSECRNKKLDDIISLNITAKNIAEIHQENLQLLHQYTNLFLKSIEGVNVKLIEDLVAESEPVMRLLAEFLEEASFKPADTDSDTISGRLLANIRALNPSDMNEKPELLNTLIQQLTGLKIILTERISELADPIGELRKTVSALKSSLEEINDISVLLQSGKDREALNRIIKFSELSQKTLRLYPILKTSGIYDINSVVIDDRNISDYYIDLNGILSELVEAFSANDSVLIGDLLEYEVAPRLNSLIDVLENIVKEQQE